MKKNKDKIPSLRNEGRPTKPPLPQSGKPRLATGLSYDGRQKTKKMPPCKAGTGPAKPVFKAAGSVPPPKPGDTSWPDQIPRQGHKSRSPAGREQYVRIRIRVHSNRLTVLDSHLVDGPLAKPKQFSGTNVYEVTVGDRLLHAEALPDLGVQRSFVNPAGSKEQRGHYITERSIFEFMARVPANEVSEETIGKMAVRLYRLKDEARTDSLGTAPLARQFEREVRQVAELIGLPKSVLPEAIEERGGRTPSV
jgi:hypothetical protein